MKNLINSYFSILMILALSANTLRAQDFWESITQTLSGTVNALERNTNGDLFAGTMESVVLGQVGAIYRSSDNGTNWTKLNTGLDSTSVTSFAINANGHIFAGTSDFYGTGLGIWRSTDNGDNWTEINNGLTNTAVRCLAINQIGEIFAGTEGGGVLKSTNNGDSWTVVNTGMTTNFIYSLLINHAGDIFAGTGQGVFRSTDNGDSWTEVNTGLRITTMTFLAVNSNDDIFAGTQNFFGTGPAGVFRSTNNGDSWTEVTPDSSVWWASSISININDHIIIGTVFSGALRSTDNGDNWTKINTGLELFPGFLAPVYSLTLNSTGKLIAGSLSGSLFRSTESTTEIEEFSGELPENFSLSQNFPNPFNPVTNIRYVLNQHTNVRLIIYDLKGREVKQLVNDFQGPGWKTVTWNASHVPSGMYFYRLTAGDFVQTRKMVLLK